MQPRIARRLTECVPPLTPEIQRTTETTDNPRALLKDLKVPARDAQTILGHIRIRAAVLGASAGIGCCRILLRSGLVVSADREVSPSCQASDGLDDAVQQLQSAAAPLLQLLTPESHDSIERINWTAAE